MKQARDAKRQRKREATTRMRSGNANTKRQGKHEAATQTRSGNANTKRQCKHEAATETRSGNVICFTSGKPAIHCYEGVVYTALQPECEPRAAPRASGV